MRQVIAERLTLSKSTIPHFNLQRSINMDNLLQFRSKVNTEHEKKLTITDFILKAVAKACKDVPETNS